uniref:Rap guanine nucleotide exchange factor 2 n=1 Tax=Eptatretus burgeri TaxID=7764 RepID=A0A8C4QKF3_EPTBU
MSSNVEAEFRHALCKRPAERTTQDLELIYFYLHGMEALSNLREPQLRSLCKRVRYEQNDANHVLYDHDKPSSCWYILLSGSVFIDGSMFLPRSSFGKRAVGSVQRGTECVLLEPSEMIVVDYAEDGEDTLNWPISLRQSRRRFRMITPHGERHTIIDDIGDGPSPTPGLGSITNSSLPSPLPTPLPSSLQSLLPEELSKLHLGEGRHRTAGSLASETESSSLSDIFQAGSEASDMDLSGLTETVVDSDEDDEEDGEQTSVSLSSRDLIRDCMEKDPVDRTDDDIEQLLDFMQQFPAFANMTMSVRRELCSVMVFAVVDQAGTTVLRNEEELDSWCVIVNGAVEIIERGGQIKALGMGNGFGVTPSLTKQYMIGDMQTKVDDCQFVCVTQQDYCRILNKVERNMQRVEEEGEVVLVKEHRELDRTGTRKGHIVIKGTPERLINHLVEEHSVVDPTYVEDFLLTWRTFLPNGLPVGHKLLTWFHDTSLRDKVTRVVLLWVCNHFSDFESDPKLMCLLENFETFLGREKMIGHLQLLNIACSTKARLRNVTLLRSSRESPLEFELAGGLDAIYVSKLKPGSKADECGLQRGDQIVEVNGHSFVNISVNKAEDLLKKSTHLSISVKNSLLSYKTMCYRQEECNNTSPVHKPRINSKRYSIPDLTAVEPLPCADTERKSNSLTKNKLFKLMAKSRINLLPPKPNDVPVTQDDSILAMKATKHGPMPQPPTAGLSSSNPDLVQCHHSVPGSSPEFADQVVRVYRADQSSRYVLMSRESTAREVVVAALREFQLQEPPDGYCLCEVSVTPAGLIKQSRLPDSMVRLAEKIQLNARYYLKNVRQTETLCSDEDAQELQKEAQTSLLHLSSAELAAQLSVRDFQSFAAIPTTEYVEDVFRLSNATTPHLRHFEQLLNQETFWVPSALLCEGSAVKRAKVVKHFLKVAMYCRENKNFNSMFAIISGLSHSSVTRLRHTWDKLPSKYEKLFQDLQGLFDPSRNMAKYRAELSSSNLQPPVIPLFPVVKKDLTFIHEGNDSYVDGLVNFEKLRMIAKEVRGVGRLAAATQEPAFMFRQRSLSQGSAGVGSLDPSLGGGHKKRHRRSSFLNPKKLYEEALMARRVRQYLAGLSVERDEDQLLSLSLQCEPAANTLPRATDKKALKAMDSLSGTLSAKQQTLPTVTLHPSGRRVPLNSLPPFGMTSPQSLQKILSLAERGGSERLKPKSDDSLSITSSQSDPSASPQHSPHRVVARMAQTGSANELSSHDSIDSNHLLDATLCSQCQTGNCPRHTSGTLAPGSEDLNATLVPGQTRSVSPAKGSKFVPGREPGDRLSATTVRDSGRSSWTSCSSDSNDNLHAMQHTGTNIERFRASEVVQEIGQRMSMHPEVQAPPDLRPCSPGSRTLRPGGHVETHQDNLPRRTLLHTYGVLPPSPEGTSHFTMNTVEQSESCRSEVVPGQGEHALLRGDTMGELSGNGPAMWDFCRRADFLSPGSMHSRSVEMASHVRGDIDGGSTVGEICHRAPPTPPGYHASRHERRPPDYSVAVQRSRLVNCGPDAALGLVQRPLLGEHPQLASGRPPQQRRDGQVTGSPHKLPVSGRPLASASPARPVSCLQPITSCPHGVHDIGNQYESAHQPALGHVHNSSWDVQSPGPTTSRRPGWTHPRGVQVLPVLPPMHLRRTPAAHALQHSGRSYSSCYSTEETDGEEQVSAV